MSNFHISQGGSTATGQNAYLGIPGSLESFYSGSILAGRFGGIAQTADASILCKFGSK